MTSRFLTKPEAWLLVFFVVLFSSCYMTYELSKKSYKYDNDIDFTVEKVVEGHGMANGNSTVYAKKGYKFVMLFTTFSNNSDEKKQLDFNNFFLLDTITHTKYGLSFTMSESVINIWTKDDPKIGKKDTKKRKLIFAFPEKQKAELMMVNENIVPIKYTGKHF